MICIREDAHTTTEKQNKMKNTYKRSEDTFFPQSNGVPDLIDVIGDLIDDDYVRSSTTEYPKEQIQT